MRFYLKDPVTGQPSVTLTMFVTGFMVALLKLIASGITINKFHLDSFTGADFAAVTGALGLIYSARRYTSSKDNPPKDSE